MRAAAVLVAAALVAGCPSVRTTWRPTSGRLVVDSLPYGPHEKQRLDLYAPEGPRGVPLLVFVHGGTWASGDRAYFAWATGLYGNVGKALADEGVATAIPSYRLWPEATLEDMLDDVAAAVKAARARAADVGADPTKIFLAGHSAGGHLAALLAARGGALADRGIDPSWIRGVVVVSGVLDAGRAVERSSHPAVPALFPDEATRRAASPLSFLRGSTTPWLFLVGEKDYPGLRADFKDARNLRLPDATFVEIRGKTHADMVLDVGAPGDPVARTIGAFVRAVAATP